MVSRLTPRMLEGEVLKEIYADILAKDWRPLYKQRNMSTVRHFYKKHDILLSDHASARFTGQKIGRRKQHVSEVDIANAWAKPLNFKESKNRLIKHYDGVVLVYNAHDNVVVSIISSDKWKKGWVRV